MIMNVPNSLTVGRIVIVFIFLLLANISESLCISANAVYIIRVIAYILAIIAGITDLLDGYIARKYNQVTDFGALMDPLADKVFVTAAMLMMVEFKLMPAWIAVVVITREFLVTGLRMLAIQKGEVISADRWGKLKTALQMLMLALAGASWIDLFDLRHDVFFGIKLWTIWIIFLWGIVIVTIMSGMGYFIRHRNLYLNQRPATAKKS
ncbi:MAG: CDP-diacylglycerol--glycerol-3-phosphate 3-phosphatidyltransferase [Victivallaceae bacterium]|jgi:CDP-diacylglycerol--glycerol-3-phosphate 3-phosphatidyltransferase